MHEVTRYAHRQRRAWRRVRGAIERVDDGEADGKVVGGHGEGGEHGGGQDSIPERPARQVEAHCGRKCQPDDGGLAEAAWRDGGGVLSRCGDGGRERAARKRLGSKLF